MLKIGELLQTKRKEKGLTIKSVSDATKIPMKQIKALETGNYKIFASQVYLKGFLKNYSKFLDIDPVKALAIYRREEEIKKDEPTIKVGKEIKQNKPIITPARLVFLISAVAVIGILVFIFSQISKVVQPPELSLTMPIELVAPNTSYLDVSEPNITLKGKVEVGSKLFINGNEVTPNGLQEFQIDSYALNPGNNEINILAESYYFSKSNQITLNIFYKIAEENEIPENPEPEPVEEGSIETMKIKIDVGSEPAWLVVDIDGNTVVTEVAPVEKIFEFEATNSMQIYTPKVNTVKLYINDIIYDLNPEVPTTFIIQNGEIIIQ